MYRKISMALCFVMVFSLFGCKKSNKTDTQNISNQNSQNTQKAPDQLKVIEEGIEKIFKALDGPVGLKLEEEDKGTKNTSKESQGSEKDSSSKKTSEKNSKSSEQSSEGEGNDKSQSKQSDTSAKPENQGTGNQQQESAKTDPWQEVNKTIQELHANWDDYAPKSMKDGASKELTDNFGNALNELTMTAMKKDSISTMLATNQLYGVIPDFYYLYKTETSPEIKKVKFYARDCVISAMKLNWYQTDSDIKNLKSSFNIFKRSLDDKNKDKGTKIENSIYELEKVEKERNKELTDIKGRLVLKDTMSLEKELEQSSKK